MAIGRQATAVTASPKNASLFGWAIADSAKAMTTTAALSPNDRVGLPVADEQRHARRREPDGGQEAARGHEELEQWLHRRGRPKRVRDDQAVVVELSGTEDCDEVPQHRTEHRQDEDDPPARPGECIGRVEQHERRRAEAEGG